METNKRSVSHRVLLGTYGADLLFVIQVVGGLGLIVPMMIQNWNNVEGVSLSFFFVLIVFSGLQTSLAIPAHKSAPSRRSAQAIFVYLMWIVLVGLHIIEILFRGMYVWDVHDTVTIVLTSVSAIFIYLWRKSKGSDFNDPVTKSQIGMTIRGIPQLLQGVKIATVGGAGLPAPSVLVANINIWIRIGHLILTRSEAKWEKNRVWMLATEVVNAISWGVVSLIWLAWRFGVITP